MFRRNRHLKLVYTNVIKTQAKKKIIVLQSQVTFCAGFISNTHIFELKLAACIYDMFDCCKTLLLLYILTILV